MLYFPFTEDDRPVCVVCAMLWGYLQRRVRLSLTLRDFGSQPICIVFDNNNRNNVYRHKFACWSDQLSCGEVTSVDNFSSTLVRCPIMLFLHLHIISAKVLSRNDAKVEDITATKRPQNVSQVLTFFVDLACWNFAFLQAAFIALSCINANAKAKS